MWYTYKLFNMSQNVLRMLWCIEIQFKFLVTIWSFASNIHRKPVDVSHIFTMKYFTNNIKITKFKK